MATSTERKPPRTWDFLLTTALILVLMVLTAVFVFGGIGLGVGAIGCGDAGEACNVGVIRLGGQLATLGTPVVALAAIVTAIVFIWKRKVAFWVPIAGIAAIALLFFVATFLVAQGVPS